MSTTTATTTVGVIGCGNIVAQYMETLSKFTNVKVCAVSDLVRDKAEAVREKWSIEKAITVDELLADPSIDIVLNLTIPLAHDEVTRNALNAGKHVYSEKPLTDSFETARELIELADSKNLALGCAPDTVMGSTWQLAREIIDSGEIGEIRGALASMQSPGPEHWHPSPAFYYDHGGGPVMDMGPYYIHALVTLLGPINTVAAMARKSSETRSVPEGAPAGGLKMPVNIKTHASALLAFDAGFFATCFMSFDVQHSRVPDIEIYGSKGTMEIHTPNNFAKENDPGLGLVTLRMRDPLAFQAEETVVERAAGPAVNGRGIGVADMAQAINEQRPLDTIRASGKLALHALEVMEAVPRASDTQAAQKMTTTCARPEAVANGWVY
ncbi:MAG: Gfo/Idh/MocA family oxidoreductase [Planctomycetota bacterium]